jgi:homopolymeric O-antigen transport system permease protein
VVEAVTALTRLSEYAQSRELTVNLTLRELRSRYKRSVLGWTWSLLNPLSNVVILSLVFGGLLRIQPPVGDPSGLHVFALFLLCGLIPWNFFSSSINGSMGALLGNANLIKKVYFPREILVLSTILSLVATMLIEMGVLLVILLFFGNMVLPWIPMVLFLIAMETVFVLGIGLVLSASNVYFRDVQHLVGILIQALFYTAPIVYPLSFVDRVANDHGQWIKTVYELNPLVVMVGNFRAVLYDLRFPPLGDVLYFGVWAFGLLFFGLWVFRKLDRRVAEEV